MENKKVYTIIIGVVLFAILSVSLFPVQEPTGLVIERTFSGDSDLLFDYEITKYPSSGTLLNAAPSEKIDLGIAVDTDNLNFGFLPGDGSFVKRFINITNLEGREAKVTIKSYGNISSLVSFKKNNFMLKGYENVLVATVFDTAGIEEGYYEGEIDVIIQRPKYEFLYSFI